MSDDAVTADTPKQTIVLVDGNALVHRAFHAIPEEMATKAGELTNATFGFTSMLLKVLSDIKPDYIAVTFDRPVPTFRHIDYQDYKIHRPALPDHFRAQFQRVRQVVKALNMPIYELDGFEADDVLGTLAQQTRKLGLQTLIVTGDMDTLQLVNPDVMVLSARKGIADIVRFDEAAVMDRFGIVPALVPDWKALTGDTSDNIPGVPGIGAKTATKLLQTYGSLEAVLQHAADQDKDIPPRQRQLLVEHADQARKSKWLATIVLDAPVTLDLEACHTHDFDRAAVRELFRELEFRSLVDRLPRSDGEAVPEQEQQKSAPAKQETNAGAFAAAAQATVATTDGPAQLALFAEAELPPLPAEPELPLIASDPDTNTVIVTDETTLAVLARSLARAPIFAFDVETDSTDAVQAKLIGISLSMGQSEAYYIPLGHVTTPTGEEPPRQLALDVVQRHLAPVFGDESVAKVGHNAKFDSMVLERHGMPVNGVTFDTMVAAYLVDPGRRGLGLKEQAFEVLGQVMTPITKLIGTGSKQISFAQVPVRAAANYSGVDADMTLRLMRPLEAKLHELHLWQLFTEVEMPLIAVLARMEQAGILIETSVLERMAVDLAEQIAALETAIYEAVGHQFNINSTKQLGDVLFSELKLPMGRKTKTGGYSVDADVLEGLKGTHPAVDVLLEYRTLAKLKSTYVDGLRELINPHDGRIHTSFNQAVASSGRLSSANPNLQNIPIRTEVGRRIRRAFVAAPGHVLLSADYAQIELRILAHITHEPALVSAFAADEDIHRVTASRLYGITPAEVTSDQRRMAKTVTYAIIYGQSPFGLARTAGMPHDQARQFIQTFEESFPGVKEYVRSTLQHVRTEGYVQTLLGRKRFIRNMMDLPVVQRQAAEREAINMPIQGTNADIIKKAMIALDAALRDLNLQTRMILQVHDELVFEVPDAEVELAASLVCTHMENAMKLDVPLRVEVKAGRDWYSTEPVVTG
jgi:DNA polymerase I